MKFKKKMRGVGSGWGGGGVRVGGKGICERRIEVFVNFFFFCLGGGSGGVGLGVGLGSQGGCERRIEVFG